MTNVQFDSIEEYEDIETLNMYKERLEKGYQPEEIMHSIYARSRDNALSLIHIYLTKQISLLFLF